MRRCLYILLLILSMSLMAHAQDSLRFTPHAELTQDHRAHRHAVAATDDLSLRDSLRLYRKPDAMRAVWMGAIIPGYGQIYNRSYWKLPIVYGAFFGCAYAIIKTNSTYTDYKTAYRDIYTDINAGSVAEVATKSYIAILPKGYTLTQVGGASKWMTTLQSRQNTYRRYRDLSIVAGIAVYALSLVDAYVDAQLFDFDISDDLSMTVQPSIGHDYMNHPTGEMHLAFSF